MLCHRIIGGMWPPGVTSTNTSTSRNCDPSGPQNRHAGSETMSYVGPFRQCWDGQEYKPSRFQGVEQLSQSCVKSAWPHWWQLICQCWWSGHTVKTACTSAPKSDSPDLVPPERCDKLQGIHFADSKSTHGWLWFYLAEPEPNQIYWPTTGLTSLWTKDGFSVGFHLDANHPILKQYLFVITERLPCLGWVVSKSIP